MSVLIKGIELPEKVQVLELHHDGKVFTRKGYLVGEAVELPDTHGDLIDRDALKEDLRMGKECDKDCPTDWKACHYDRVYVKQDFCEWLDDADVVIEAEDG